ncbi:MAG TPA: glycosyltransferase family 4 protein, partial [Sphingomicrobium sp.]
MRFSEEATAPAGGRPRVVVVNRFFHPDISATSQILSDAAFGMAAAGFAVEVVTSRARYDRSETLPATEVVRGVVVWRVTTLSGRKSLVARALTFASFYVTAAARLWRVLRPGDVLVIKTDPPLFMVLASLLAGRKGARTVNWLQDLYPEVAAELGVSLARGWTGRLLTRLRNNALRNAAANVAIGHRMAERLLSADVPPGHIRVIPNWSDDEAVTPLPQSEDLRCAWGLSGRFVIGYSGNLGRAHEIATVLAAAQLYRDDDTVRFLFVGGGDLRRSLETEVARLRLANVVWQPYQARERLSKALAVPDVHWLTLAPELEGLIVPSKVYGIMAAGRPFIFVGDRNGEVAMMAKRYDCGQVVSPKDAAGFVAAVERLRADPFERERQGRNG